jgi:hypothetical protein
LASHIKNCHECRTLVEILRWSLDESGGPFEPPTELLRRQKAIPQLIASRHPAESLPARLVSDSWGDHPAVAVREAPFGVERRLRFRAVSYVVELVADRRLEGWDFVARVYDGEILTRQFILKVGRRKLVPGRGDCYFWSSKRPPQRLQLLSGELRIDLEKVKW